MTRTLAYAYVTAVVLVLSIRLYTGDGAPPLLAYMVVLVSLPINWYVTWRLWRLSRAAPTVRVLHERALTSLSLAVIVTVFAGIFLNNGMETPLLEPFTTMLITRTAVLALALPALYWLWLYRKS